MAYVPLPPKRHNDANFSKNCLEMPPYICNVIGLLAVSYCKFTTTLVRIHNCIVIYIANPSVKDDSGYTAMDYATQRGLHYCALLLSQSNGFDETDKCVLAIQMNYIQLPIGLCIESQCLSGECFYVPFSKTVMAVVSIYNNIL